MTKARDLASASIVPAAVSVTELGYIDGVTSAIQTQMNTKAATSAAINPTIVDAKGDLIAATGADAVSRLAVGANATVLTADSAEATGMKWAAAGAGASWSEYATGSLTGSSITVSSLTGSELLFSFNNFAFSGSTDLRYRPNNNSGSIYRVQTGESPETSAKAWGTGTSSLSSFIYIPAATATSTVRVLLSNLYPWAMASATAITSMTFFPASGTFSSGTYTVWQR